MRETPPPTVPGAGPSLTSQVVSFGLVQAVLKVRSLIAIPILARLIGAEGYGIVSLLLAFGALLQNLTLFGTNSALTVFIPSIPDARRRAEEFWTLFVAVLLGSTVVTAGVLLGAPWILDLFFPPGFRLLHYCLGVLLVVTGTVNALLYSQVVNNRQAAPYAAWAAGEVAAELVFLCVFAYLWGVTGFLVSAILGQSLLALFIAGLVLRRDPFAGRAEILRREVGKYYRYGAYMFFTGLGGLVIEWSDRFIIGKFLPLSDLGTYQVAYGLCRPVADLSVPLFSALMPFVVAAVAEGRTGDARRYLEKTYRAAWLLYAPVLVFFAVAGEPLLRLVATDAFAEGAVVMPWVALAQAVAQILGVYTYLLHAHRKGPFIAYTFLPGGAFNLLLNFLLIPRFGLLGAAWATLLVYLLCFAVLRRLSLGLLSLTLGASFSLRLLLVTGLLAVAAGAAVRLAPGPLSALAAVAVLTPPVYLGGAWAAGLFAEFEPDRFLRPLRHLWPGRPDGG